MSTPGITRSPMRLAVQVLGFVLSLGLLYWAAASALDKPGMADRLARLAHTPWWLLALLVSLSTITIAWSGLVFWITLRPVRRLRPSDLIAVNAVSTLLGFAPFKLGLVFRMLLHVRKDRMPLLLVTGWMVASGIIVLLSFTGALMGTWWRGGLDGWWWALALGLPAVGGAGAMIAGRRLARSKSLRWAHARPWARNLVGALDMLAHPTAVFGGLALRGIDIATQAARFYFAAEAARLAGIVDQGLTAEQSVLAGSTYFLVQALSPAGTLGPREALTTALLGAVSKDNFALVVLVVTAADTAGSLILGGWGLAWLRPARFFFRRERAGGAAGGRRGRADGPGAGAPVPSAHAPGPDPDQSDRRRP